MTRQQMLILSILIFFVVTVMGCAMLIALEKVVP